MPDYPHMLGTFTYKCFMIEKINIVFEHLCSLFPWKCHANNVAIFEKHCPAETNHTQHYAWVCHEGISGSGGIAACTVSLNIRWT